VATKIRPAVVIDTSNSVATDTTNSVVTDTGELSTDSFTHNLRVFEESRLLDDRVVVVMPHTNRAESFLGRYAHGVGSARPGDDPSSWTPPPETVWDPAAPPDPLRYTCPVPVQASFKVTGLVQDGRWRDPSDLDAARSLLQARYDLKIGIWDLVNNPTLRRTLLDVAPIPEAPPQTIEVPAGAGERARRRVAAKAQQRAQEAEARHRMDPFLQPLRDIGWRTLTRRVDLCLPLTELIPLSTIRRAQSWPDDEPFPLVQLDLAIGKRQSEISAFTIMYNLVDLKAYARSRRRFLEDVASPEICTLAGTGRLSLWRTHSGWADDAEWGVIAAEVAKRSSMWQTAFEDLCKECRGFLERWATTDQGLRHTASLQPPSPPREGLSTLPPLGQPPPLK
jgi:hypothetical protein